MNHLFPQQTSPAPLMPLVALVLLPPQKDDLSNIKVRPRAQRTPRCCPSEDQTSQTKKVFFDVVVPLSIKKAGVVVVVVVVCLNAWPCWHLQIPGLWIVRSLHLSIFSLTLQTILTWIDLAASPFAPPFSTTVLAADIPARPPPTTITWFAGNTAAIAAIRCCESAKSRRVTKKCLRMPKKTCLKFLKQFLYRLYLGVIP